MLQPSKTKFRKQQKGRNNKRVATKGNEINFGEFGLKAVGHSRITARQIEASRIVISKYMKRGGKVWIRIFPDKPITEKPIEVRQGKGKGNVEYWVSLVQPGKVLFEVAGVSHDVAYRALKLASYKLPVKTVFVSRVML
ncbi:MAG TPA: 50S ribosomal protein L16 [Candidatus Azoamicus sp. OHIO1]